MEANYGEDQPYVVLDGTGTEQERADAWAVGFGLQAVDGLTPSSTVYALATEHISGRTSYAEVEQRLRRHYADSDPDDRQREADFSSARIARIIQTPGFGLAPAALKGIHREVFTDVYPDEWVGRWRTVAIGKPEPVLGGWTVEYAAPFLIEEMLADAFAKEEAIDWLPAEPRGAIDRVLRFISRIWQIHPFREGNTRTSATYAVLYMRHLGVDITNDPFAKRAEFFRDALVLDNAPHRMRDREPLLRFGAALAGDDVDLSGLRGTDPATRG